MFNLNDQAVRGGNFCLSKAGLVIAGTTSKAQTVNPDGANGLMYVIDGVLKYLTDADNNIVLTGDVQTALYSNIYLVTINVGGTIAIVQSTEVLTVDLAAGRTQLHWPTPADGYCAIGAIVVDAGAGTFTPGSTALTGGTVTVEYIDLFSLPVQPIRS